MSLGKSCCYGRLCVAKVENILLKEDGNYVLCDYGSCSLEILIPEVCMYVVVHGCGYRPTCRKWAWLTVKSRLRDLQH